MPYPALPYSFYGEIKDGILCRDPEVVIAGPADCGKTVAILWKLHVLAMKYAGAHLSIIRKVKADLEGTALRTFKRDILRFAPYVEAYGGQRPDWYDYPNGSRIWVGGLDKPGKTLSAERDLIYVNQCEQLSMQDWEYLTRCVTGRGAVIPYTQLVGDCNPASPTHWILSRRDRGVLTFFNAKHEDNPELWDHTVGEWTQEGKQRLFLLKRGLSGSRLKRLFYGLWVAPEGAIYSNFDEEVHLIKSFDIPRTWPRFVGVDPYGAFIAAIWIAYDPQSRKLNVYREYVKPFGITTQAHVENILEASKRETVFAWVGGGPSENQARLDFSGHGLPLIPSPITEVWAGIDRVNSLLKENRIVVHDSCINLLSEIGDYRRRLKNGEPTDTIEDKEKYHCLSGSTLVLTENGQKQIKDISVGEKVLTRNGYCSVIVSRCTNLSARVFRVNFDNGSSLVGTGNHRVWVKGKGWIELCALRSCDIVITESEARCQNEEKRSRRSDGHGEGIRITQEESTLQQVSLFTFSLGLRIADLFRKVLLFIIETEMSRTTISPIWRWSPILNTDRCMGRNPRVFNTCATSSQKGVSHLENGIVPRRGARIIGNWVKRLGRVENRLHEYANGAVKIFRRAIGNDQPVSVPYRVDHGLAMRLGLTTKNAHARDAVRSSLSISTTRPDSVPVRVLHVIELQDEMPVYNLTVLGTHEFFANGILVANCLDALRYIVSYLTSPVEEREVVDYSVQIGPVI